MDALSTVSVSFNTATRPANTAPMSEARSSGAAFSAFIDVRPSAGVSGAPAAQGAQPSGWKQLETLLVQNMLQGVMTTEEGGFFGEGLGSDYYQSFMIEQFAARLADGLDLGIASRLDRHYGSGDHL